MNKRENPQGDRRKPQGSAASGRTTRNILVAFDWYDQRIFEGIFRFAKERGWHFSPHLLSARTTPKNWPGDGAITCYGAGLASHILSLKIPKVDVSIELTPEPIPRVVVDNAAIARMAAEHFLDRGFHDFAYYSWPKLLVSRVRGEAFTKSLADAGVPRSHIHEIRQSPAHLLGEWGQHQADILRQLERLPRPLGVFAGMDNLGATLIEICVRSGIAVPEEIAVLGVDNIQLLCESMVVPLSSIDTRLDEVGYRAAEQLERLMDGAIKATAEPVLIPPREVITRQSTDILAIPHPLVVKALAFMKENSHRPITLDDVSQVAGMSKRGLEKAFFKHLSISPADELRRIRLAKAKIMLMETDSKIDAIAHECGYSNSSNLSLALRRESKLSPRAYRNAFRKLEGYEESPARASA